jgi:hypothetical protein
LKVEKNPMLSYNFGYDATKNHKLSDISKYFKNAGPDRCKIKDCYIKSKSCKADLSVNSLSRNIFMVKNEIFARQIFLEGYQETVCIECTNGLQIIQQPNV